MSHSATTLSDATWKQLDARTRQVDEDRWLSSRYAQPADRRGLTSLYLLNHELARIRSVVTEPGLGAIRFQWWRDALAELSGGNLYRHDVIGALAEQVKGGLMRVDALQKLVDGHEAAFHAKDRSLEPDRQLTAMAAQTLTPAHGWGGIEQLAPHVAALKRGENVGYGPVVSKVPTGIRPAIAHFRLRRILGKASSGGPIARRICVMRAILSGEV